MDTGVISSRYARALLKYVLQTGGGERVFTQVRALLEDPDILSSSALEPELGEFTALLSRNGRLGYARLIFTTFVRMYCEKEGIRLVTLSTAAPAPELAARLQEVISGRTGWAVIMDTKVDPGLIGGFVVESDDRRLDASVRSQLDRIRRQFTETNRRIV